MASWIGFQTDTHVFVSLLQSPVSLNIHVSFQLPLIVYCRTGCLCLEQTETAGYEQMVIKEFKKCWHFLLFDRCSSQFLKTVSLFIWVSLSGRRQLTPSCEFGHKTKAWPESLTSYFNQKLTVSVAVCELGDGEMAAPGLKVLQLFYALVVIVFAVVWNWIKLQKMAFMIYCKKWIMSNWFGRKRWLTDVPACLQSQLPSLVNSTCGFLYNKNNINMKKCKLCKRNDSEDKMIYSKSQVQS